MSKPPREISYLSRLLGCTPLSADFLGFISDLQERAANSKDNLSEVKIYGDCVYISHRTLDISFQFLCHAGYTPCNANDLDMQRLSLDCIDIFNSSPDGVSGFPDMPLSIGCSGANEIFILHSKAVAQELVTSFGEPSRKGGGGGPSSGSINIWCEWLKQGVMVEFGGDLARGPDAWVTGKDAIWKVLTIFTPQA